MKSKLVILSLLLAGSVATATAQEKEKFYSERFKDNIFFSVGVGGHLIANDDSYDELGFGSSLAPMVSMSLGKYFNPVWGVRGQATAVFKAKLASDMPFVNINQADTENFTKLKRTHGNLHADALMNLTNLFAGYKEGRCFELIAFAGPSLSLANGYGRSTVAINEANEIESVKWENKKFRAHLGASVGLGAKFNINNHWAIDVEARGYITPSIYVAQSNQKSGEGAITALVGTTYTFGGKKFVSCNKVDQNAINSEINKYRQALADAEDELAKTKNALANAKGKTVEVTKEIEVAGPRAIFFQIGKSEIDEYGKVNIQLAAKIIKANPGKKYKVAGYADKATGSASYNQKLTEKRAQAVYDALIAEGVSASQLEYVGFGGVDNMFNKDRLNRVVILE